MKKYTKYLKNISRTDFTRITQHNNSKWDKMTDADKIKHIQDKKAFYIRKYTDLLSDATTAAQKRICLKMIENVNKYTLWKYFRRVKKWEKLTHFLYLNRVILT